jgi:hypothetical protein
MTSRRKREQSSLTKLSKLAMACWVRALGYHEETPDWGAVTLFSLKRQSYASQVTRSLVKLQGKIRCHYSDPQVPRVAHCFHPDHIHRHEQNLARCWCRQSANAAENHPRISASPMGANISQSRRRGTKSRGRSPRLSRCPCSTHCTATWQHHGVSSNCGGSAAVLSREVRSLNQPCTRGDRLGLIRLSVRQNNRCRCNVRNAPLTVPPREAMAGTPPFSRISGAVSNL